MKLGRGIIEVLCANVLNLMIAVVNGFLLPKYLPVETYADLKTFLLYLSYIGVLHFGYIDGIYIKYGGKDLCTIQREQLAIEKKVLVLFQIIMSVPVMLIGIFMGNLSFIFISLCIMPYNLIYFYKIIYQVTGSFQKYKAITVLCPALIFILQIFFIFILKAEKSTWFIGIQVMVYFLVFIYYGHKSALSGFRQKVNAEKVKIVISENIKLGFVIMLGNFMGVWITSIDRWFVKFCCSVWEFAHYSFAVTMLRLINTVVTAFSITLYNYLCRNPEISKIYRLRKAVFVSGAAVIGTIFPISWIIRLYINNYAGAVLSVQILFAAQFILIGVNAIYLNLYKVHNLQKKYLFRMGIVTIVAFLMNAAAGSIWRNIAAYALATLCTSVIWLALCQHDLPNYKLDCNEWIYIVLVLTGYFTCNYFATWAGMCAYICWIFLVTFLMFHREVGFWRDMLIKIIKSECRK